ncbi:MAG: fibrobacter succinogenes major paralogous domain-containing protein, partial [Bacteroidales bacterium]|nr:fibrobacter succinogenes major paralogous domain-containing protein [Bacteroidales bacterium]
YAKTAEKEVYSEDMKVVMQDPEGLVDCGLVEDADGNQYRTVKLGKQCWTRENLHTTKLSDGTPMTMFEIIGNTSKLPMEGTGYVPVINSKDTLPKEVSGYFYNYGAALSAVSPCPVGWRVATFDDYMNLYAYIQTTYDVSGTLNINKSTGSVGVNVAPYMCLPYYWNGKPLKSSTNETGFNYFYAGDINWSVNNGGYSFYRFEGRYDALLTSTVASGTSPWFMQTTGNTTWQKYFNSTVSYGQYIRCAKDAE